MGDKKKDAMSDRDALRTALERFDAAESRLAYWQEGSGHRDRLRTDLRKLHGGDYATNTDARVTAIVQEALRDFITNASLRAALTPQADDPSGPGRLFPRTERRYPSDERADDPSGPGVGGDTDTQPDDRLDEDYPVARPGVGATTLRLAMLLHEVWKHRGGLDDLCRSTAAGFEQQYRAAIRAEKPGRNLNSAEDPDWPAPGYIETSVADTNTTGRE